jgi:enoyl-CoA hydratase
MSAIEQFDLPFEQAMANEFKHGLQSLEKEAGPGAARFAKGAGRHGHFETPDQHID